MRELLGLLTDRQKEVIVQYFWEQKSQSEIDYKNGNNMYTWENWNNAVNYWQASKQNRQINWNRLYYANQQAAKNMARVALAWPRAPPFTTNAFPRARTRARGDYSLVCS